MNPGYDKPLYLLPFDHRHSYVADMFGFTQPITHDQRLAVLDSKQVIYEGFQRALFVHGSSLPAGILVDEEFGSAILIDARRRGFVTALSVEASGSAEFEFEYGDAFATHIESFKPTFAKVLVRYNPAGDEALNARQRGRLARLSRYCAKTQQPFMFELLVPATPAQLATVGGRADRYDELMRPDLMARAIHELQEAGIEPDIWKMEGLDHVGDAVRMVEVARREGRSHVGCIVLGRGANEEKVSHWLRTAGAVPGFIGFAVGRTTFWEAIAGFKAHTLTRQQAVDQIARRFLEWVHLFTQPLESQELASTLYESGCGG